MPHAKIKTHQATITLEQLHAELAGKILDNKAEADRLREAMLHVEAVIKLMDPTHNLRTIAVRRRKPNEWFKRGSVARTAIDVLRRAGEPLTASEIAERMLATKGITEPPRAELSKLVGAIRAALRKGERKVVCAFGHERPIRWRLL